MSAEAIVMRQVSFYNARDLEGFLSTYREDAVIEFPAQGVVVARGRDAIRAAYAKLFAANPDLNCAVVGCIVKGDCVAISEKITGRADEGVREALGVYQVKGGLITRAWFF